MRVFVLTDQGWTKEENVFTPATGKIKKNAEVTPIKATEDMTVKLNNELPMVRIVRGYYYIQSV